MPPFHTTLLLYLIINCSQICVIYQKATFLLKLGGFYCFPLASHCSEVEFLWAASDFLETLQALMVHPAPIPLFLGNQSVWFVVWTEPGFPCSLGWCRFPWGRRSLFPALRQCCVLGIWHAAVLRLPSQLPAAVGRLKSWEQQKSSYRCLSMNAVAQPREFWGQRISLSPSALLPVHHCTLLSFCLWAPLFHTLLSILLYYLETLFFKNKTSLEKEKSYNADVCE